MTPYEIANLALSGIQAVGNIFGQYKSNQTNLKIARETNQMNMEQNALNRQMQFDLFNQANQYNSPVNQRKMLEAAGYSPYALFENGGQAQSVSGSVPSSIPAQPAQVSPLRFDGANDFAAMAAGLDKMRDVQSKGITNDFLFEMLQAQLNKLGLEVQQGEVALDIQKQTADLVIQQEQMRTQRQNFENELAYMYGQELQAVNLENLYAQIDLLAKQGSTEISKQELNKALKGQALNDIKYKQIQSSINQYLAKYQAQVYGTLSKFQQAQTTYQNILNDIGRKYGVYDKLIDMANKWQMIGNTYQKSKMLQELTKAITIKNKFLPASQVSQIAQQISSALNSLSQTALNIKSLFGLGDSGGMLPIAGMGVTESIPFEMTSTIPFIP